MEGKGRGRAIHPNENPGYGLGCWTEQNDSDCRQAINYTYFITVSVLPVLLNILFAN